MAIAATATSPNRVRYDALLHQSQCYLSEKRHVVLFGGVGSGKTDFDSLWIFKKLKEVEDWPQDKAQAIICANTYDQLIHSTIRNIFGNWRKWGIYFEPNDVPKSGRPFTLRVVVNGQWRDLLCRSLDQPESLRGTEVGFAVVDEAVGTTVEAVGVVNARVRATEQPLNQILYSTTKDEPTHWMHEMFVENFDPNTMHIVEAETADNPHLPPDYIDGLRATYSERQFQREVLNMWVALAEGQIYYSFERGIHVDIAAEYDDDYPVIWTHDFNVGTDSKGKSKPMSSVLGQEKRGTYDGRRRLEAHAFDEIVIDSSDTGDACEEFFARYGTTIDPEQVIICGDASGRAKDTRSKTSDYGILLEYGFKVQDVPRANPALRTRHNRCNGLLKNAAGDVRARLHPRCKTLAKGLETVRLKPGATYLELETREQHVTTAWGYWIARRFPEESQRAAMGGALIKAK